MAPTTNMKLPGRQTNNSLSSLTGNIFIQPISGTETPAAGGSSNTTQTGNNSGSSGTTATETSNVNKTTSKKDKQTVAAAGPSTSTAVNRNKKKSKSEVKKKASKVVEGAYNNKNKVIATTSKLIQPNQTATANNSKPISFTETDEVLQIGMHKVLVYVKNHRDAWPFMDPVEEDIAPRYYSIIRRPMDLLKMEDRLDNGDYKKFSEFRNDFKLIVNNCRLYNGQNNEYTQMVNNLQNAFDKATKKYFDQNSDDDDTANLGYPADTKTSVFREKNFYKPPDGGDSKKSVASSTSTSQVPVEEKPMSKKKEKRNAGGCGGGKGMRTEEVDDSVEDSKINKRKRKEKDKRRKKKTKAKNGKVSDDDDDIDYESRDDINDHSRNMRKRQTESISDISELDDAPATLISKKATNTAKKNLSKTAKKNEKNKKKLEKEKEKEKEKKQQQIVAPEKPKSSGTKKYKRKSKKFSKHSKKLTAKTKEPDPEPEPEPDDDDEIDDMSVVDNTNVDVDDVDVDVDGDGDGDDMNVDDDDEGDEDADDDDNHHHLNNNYNYRNRQNHHHNHEHFNINAISNDNNSEHFSDISVSEQQPVKKSNKHNSKTTTKNNKINGGKNKKRQQHDKNPKRGSDNKKLNTTNDKKFETATKKKKSKGKRGHKKQSTSKKLVCDKEESEVDVDEYVDDEDDDNEDSKFIQPKSMNLFRNSKITDDEDEDDETSLSSSPFKVDLHKKYATCPLTDDLDLLDDKKFAKMSAKSNWTETKTTATKTRGKSKYNDNDDNIEDFGLVPSPSCSSNVPIVSKTPSQSDVENSVKVTFDNKKTSSQKNTTKKSKKNNSSKNNTESDTNAVVDLPQHKDNNPEPPLPLFLDKYDLIKQRRNRANNDDKWNQIVKQAAEKSKGSTSKSDKKEKNQKLRETIEKLKEKSAKSKEQSVLIDEIFGVKPTQEIRDEKAIFEKLRETCVEQASVSGTKKLSPTTICAVDRNLSKGESDKKDSSRKLPNVEYDNLINAEKLETYASFKKEKRSKKDKSNKNNNEIIKDSLESNSGKSGKKSSSKRLLQQSPSIPQHQSKQKAVATATVTTATITSATATVITAVPVAATVTTSTITSATFAAPAISAANLNASKPIEMAALDLETEQTLKDINRWLEYTPRFTEFSSASNSPSRYILLEDFEAVTAKIDANDFRRPGPIITAKVESNANKTLETFQEAPSEPEMKINKRKMSLPEKKRSESPAIAIKKTIEATSSVGSSCGTPPHSGHSLSGGSTNANASSSSSSTPPNTISPVHVNVVNVKPKELNTIQLITNPPPPPNIKAIQLKEAKRKTLKEKLTGTTNQRRKDLMTTIERLKPGKTKGNLIQTSTKPEDVSIGSVPKIKEIKNSLVVKTDENGPKLSLGSVLNTEKFGLGGHSHNFADKSNADDLSVTKASCNNSLNTDEFRKDDETLIYKRSMQNSPHEDSNNSVESIKDDKSTDSFSRVNSKSSNTPNFSAWFKAFGGKKKKKSEDDEGKLDNYDYSQDKSNTSPSTDMTSAVSFNTMKSNENIYSIPSVRQRKASTGSTISERSSFSQDPDSPRIGIDERFGTYPGAYTSPIGASPIGASPIMVSPKPEDIGKPNSPYPLNGAIKVGFYQDTTTKSSPDKSCSPRELPSPYPQYSQHIYTSGSSPNVSASEMSGSSPYGGHSYNPASNEPNKTPVYPNTSPVPNSYEHYKQPHSQESDYNSSMSPSTPNPHSPYQQPQSSPYHQPQHSPYQQGPVSPYHQPQLSPYRGSTNQHTPNPSSPTNHNIASHSPQHEDISNDSSSHHLHSTPSPHQMHSTPSPHHLHTSPTPHQMHSSPTPHQMHSSPTPHQMHSSPTPHQMHSSPTSHQMHSSPTSHQMHSSPTSHQMHSSPTPHQMHSSPTQHQMHSSPTQHQMHSSPTPHQMHSSPSPLQMHSSPSPHHMHSSPSPHHMHSSPSPHHMHSSPSPQPQHSPIPLQHIQRDSNKSSVLQHSPYHQASSPYQPLQVATSPYSNPSSPYQHQAASPVNSSTSPTQGQQQLSPIHSTYNHQHPNSPPAISPPIIPQQQQLPTEHTAYEREHFNYQQHEQHNLQTQSALHNQQNIRSMYDHPPSPEIVKRTASVVHHSADWQKNQELLSSNNSQYSSIYHNQYTPPTLTKDSIDLPDTKHHHSMPQPIYNCNNSDVTINLSQHRTQAQSHPQPQSQSHHSQSAHPLQNKTVISSIGNMKRSHTGSESDLISLGYSSNEISSALSNKIAKRDEAQQLQQHQIQHSQHHSQQQQSASQPPMKSYETSLNKHQQMFDSFLGSMAASKNLVGFGKPLDISATKALEVFNHAATMGFPKDFPSSLINSAVSKDLHHQALQQQTTSLQHHLQSKIMENAQLGKPLNMVNSGNGSYNSSPTQLHQQQHQHQQQQQQHHQHQHQQQQQLQLIYGNPKVAHSQQTQLPQLPQQHQQHQPQQQHPTPPSYPTNLVQSTNIDKSNDLIIPNPRQEQQLSNHLAAYKFNDPLRNLNHSLASMLDETMLISNTSGVGFYDKSMPPAAHMFSSGKNLSQQMYHNTSPYGSAVAAAAAAARDQQNPPAPGNYVPTVSVHSAPPSGVNSGLGSSSHTPHHHSIIEPPQAPSETTKPARKPRKKKGTMQNSNDLTSSASVVSSGMHNSSVQNMMLGSLGVGPTTNQMHHTTHHSQLQAQPAHQNTSQAQALHQGFQLYAGLKTAGITSSSTPSATVSTVASSSSVADVTPISLKTASATSMVPGSAFNFGPSPPGLGLATAIYGDNPSYLDDFRGPPNPYYMTSSHRSSSGDGSVDKSGNGNSSSAVAAAAAAAAANPYPFLTHASTRSPYPFINSTQIDPNSPFYQQYIQRQDELRSRMILNPGILGPPTAPPAGYPQPSFRPPLGMPSKHHYDINRPAWF